MPERVQRNGDEILHGCRGLCENTRRSTPGQSAAVERQYLLHLQSKAKAKVPAKEFEMALVIQNARQSRFGKDGSSVLTTMS